MNVSYCCQMAQVVAEEMGFGQGWNSPSHTNLAAQISLLNSHTLLHDQIKSELGSLTKGK